MRRSSLVVPAAALVAAAGFSPIVSLSAARGAEADLRIVDHSVAVDTSHKTATFTLTFDHKPDFAAAGESAGQANAFQYEIDAHHTNFDTPLTFNDIDTVVRGAELWEGHGLPVRNRDGDGGGDAAGGWGPVRALLPYQVADNTVTFTAALSAIGDTDGKFRYRVLATDNGTVSSEAQGAVVPLPAGVWTGVTMLGALGATGTLWKRKR